MSDRRRSASPVARPAQNRSRDRRDPQIPNRRARDRRARAAARASGGAAASGSSSRVPAAVGAASGGDVLSPRAAPAPAPAAAPAVAAVAAPAAAVSAAATTTTANVVTPVAAPAGLAPASAGLIPDQRAVTFDPAESEPLETWPECGLCGHPVTDTYQPPASAGLPQKYEEHWAHTQNLSGTPTYRAHSKTFEAHPPATASATLVLRS
ncbi:hypothetical protein V8F20_001831 [Naviculisporaceae sp. PSN 640]